MREKSKNFRIDSTPRTTTMIKFSARSDLKKLPLKNWLPIKLYEPFFRLYINSQFFKIVIHAVKIDVHF